MSGPVRPQICVFWDESARPKPTLGGHSVVKSIRAFASKLGSLKSVRFYVDVSGSIPSRTLSATLRSDLQCSGVTIVDTASNGRPGAPSKMLMADLFLSAMDNAEGVQQSLPVVITADPDLGYAVSLLRARGQEVLVLCPTRADGSIVRLASESGNGFEDDLFDPFRHPGPIKEPDFQRAQGSASEGKTDPSYPLMPSTMTTISNSRAPPLVRRSCSSNEAGDPYPLLNVPGNESDTVVPSGTAYPPTNSSSEKKSATTTTPSVAPFPKGLKQAFMESAYNLFMEIPDRNVVSDAAAVAPSPSICVSQILGKIENQEYPTIEDFHSDWTLLCNNVRARCPGASLQAAGDALGAGFKERSVTRLVGEEVDSRPVVSFQQPGSEEPQNIHNAINDTEVVHRLPILVQKSLPDELHCNPKPTRVHSFNSETDFPRTSSHNSSFDLPTSPCSSALASPRESVYGCEIKATANPSEELPESTPLQGDSAMRSHHTSVTKDEDGATRSEEASTQQPIPAAILQDSGVSLPAIQANPISPSMSTSSLIVTATPAKQRVAIPTTPPVSVPPKYATLVACLRKKRASGELIVKLKRLGEDLMSTQPDVLDRAQIQGGKRLYKYFESAASAGIIVISKSADTKKANMKCSLQPTYF